MIATRTGQCLSICPSVTRWWRIKTDDRRVMRFALLGSPETPVFRPKYRTVSQKNTPCDSFKRDKVGKTAKKRRFPTSASQYLRNDGR